MGLRLKLFLPTLIGLLAFASFIHFVWSKDHEQELFESFHQTQEAFLKTIEPEITRALITNDLATLFALLEQQMHIHQPYWKLLTLTQANGATIYPLSPVPPPEGRFVFELDYNIAEDGDNLASLKLYLDWSDEQEIIQRRTNEIELVLLLLFAAIGLISTLWQNRLIISPLISLNEAVNKFQQGDYEHQLKIQSQDEIGELIQNFSIMRDEHRENEESLRIAAAAFDILEGIIITDNKGNILRTNQAFSEITGYSEDEVIGKNPSFLQSGRHEKVFYQQLWNEINTRGRWLGEIWNRRKSGDVLPLFTTITAVKNNKNDITHFVASYLDISETKQQQKDLEIARDKAEVASRAKSDFLATMSHEIRTPMNGVLGMAQLLSDTELNKQQRDYINTIKLSGQNLLTIINDILDFSKIEAQKMELEPVTFNLRNTSFEVARLLTSKANEKGLELLFNIAPSCPQYVIGDPGRLRQVLLNILGNAIKFTEQGHILLDIRCNNKSGQDASIVFKVSDTGIGISNEQQQQLFKPFTQADSSTTRKFGGTGLGLSICRQLVQLMGGEIQIESSVDQGSEFSFEITLPLSDEPDVLPSQTLDGLTLLIVDDNQTNLTILDEQFKSVGVQTICLESGEQALKKLKQRSLNKEKTDAVILDYCMPEMDGEELGKIILNNDQLNEIPLILLTSAGQRGDLKRFEELGFAGYLTKPVMDKTLIGMIGTVTDKRYKKHKILTSHSFIDASTSDDDNEFTTPQITNARILLAEDDLVNQQVALGILKKLSITPDVAVNGLQVLELAKTNNYDLILMDCLMPEMDGYEATLALRNTSSTENIPIIALTANAQQSDRERCIEAGMDDFISKPFEFEELIKTLNRWLPETAYSEEVETELQAVSRTATDNENKLPVMNLDIYIKLRNTIPDTFDAIVKVFLDETAVKLGQIAQYIDDENFEESTRLSHSLKSSSATLGAIALSHISSLIESSCKQEDKQASSSLATELKQTFEQTKAAIKAID